MMLSEALGHALPEDEPSATADLVAALGALPEIPKGGVARVPGRPDRRYMRLDDILTAVRPVLLNNHLAVMQDVETRERGVSVTTRLIHVSGHVFESPALVLACQPDAQSVGSAITYGKRYSLAAFMGIAADDDDDGLTAQPPPYTRVRPGDPLNQPPAGPVIHTHTPTAPVEQSELGDVGTPSTTTFASKRTLAMLHALERDSPMTEPEYRKWVADLFQFGSPDWHHNQLTQAQASAIIRRLQAAPGVGRNP
jgi:hypothetical protein